MSKSTEELVKDLESDDYDVLEDIQDEDFVFVVNSAGQLKGISWPTDMEDDTEVDATVEEIITFLVKKFTETRPPNATLH